MNITEGEIAEKHCADR